MPEREYQNRDFKGVWIPKEIWLSQDLDLYEKCLFKEIHSLDNANGCYASNKHFAGFLDVSERTISRLIKKLEQKGYLKSKTKVITSGTGKTYERVIRCVGTFRRTSDKDLYDIVPDAKGNMIARKRKDDD